MHDPNPVRYLRFMIFMEGFIASLERMPKKDVEPSLGDLFRLPDGRAQSERTQAERYEISAEVRQRALAGCAAREASKLIGRMKSRAHPLSPPKAD